MTASTNCSMFLWHVFYLPQVTFMMRLISTICLLLKCFLALSQFPFTKMPLDTHGFVVENEMDTI